MKRSAVISAGFVILIGICWASCSRKGNSSFASCRCIKGTVSKSYGLGFYTDTATVLYADTCMALQVRDTLDTCIVTKGAY